MLSRAVGKHLAAELPDVLTFSETSGNVFVEWMPSTPTVAVAIMSQPGIASLSRLPDDVPGIQVLVRGAANDPMPSYRLAQRVFDQLAGLDLVTLDSGGDDEVFLVGCSPLQSGPTSIGQDSNQRFEWSLNFSCHTYEPTTHRS